MQLSSKKAQKSPKVYEKARSGLLTDLLGVQSPSERVPVLVNFFIDKKWMK